MARMTMIEAIQNAHDIAMERDETVVVFGEDVGFFGGVFRCTAGLQKKYGTQRCFDTPISESGIVGTAIGMAGIVLAPVVIDGVSNEIKNIGCNFNIFGRSANFKYTPHFTFSQNIGRNP